ncbi:hypothetical protein JXM67_09120 [candidate division WOR-3 bacterium]|nr:hypothetical protein [candidate division WOR-3 bacterium]
MTKRFRLGFFGSIAIWIPVVLLAIFERPIVGFMGRVGWIILLIIFGLGAVVLEIFPFFAGGPSGYYFFWGKGKRAKGILATGRSAQATLTAIGENSGGGTITINDDPYLNLRLEIDDGVNKPYEVSLDTVISRFIVPQFQPGAAFPVRVDTANPQNVVYDSSQAALDGTGTIFQGTKPQISGLNRTPEETKFIRKHGIKATARIMAVEPTGRSHDFKPLVKVDYEVRIPGQTPYEITAELPIPTHMVEQFKGVIGIVFPAKVHPEDRNKISVDITF